MTVKLNFLAAITLVQEILIYVFICLFIYQLVCLIFLWKLQNVFFSGFFDDKKILKKFYLK